MDPQKVEAVEGISRTHGLLQVVHSGLRETC